MNWEAVGAVGEVFGSIAVFVTLGYLAVQVRHARGELRRSIRQGRGEAQRQLYLFRASNPRIGELSMQANKAFGVQPSVFVTELVEKAGLAPGDVAQLFSEQVAWWSYRAQVIPYVHELPPEDRIEFDATTRSHYRAPLARLWIAANKHHLNPKTVRYVEDLLAQPE